MRFRDDERGQSVQIGAVLLFATLIVAFSSYQAFVVPQQNQAVEFSHNQQVQGELQDLRNAIVSMPGGGSTTATSVTLGTTYPSRALAQNPGPPSGSLRTQGTGDERVAFSVRNATATGETGDVWNGSLRSYDTGVVSYDPRYNVYDGAPLSVYEHSVLYNEFRSGTIVTAGQTVVDGRTISLVAVNGSLERTSTGATSVDVRPVSSAEETILVEAPDGDSPVTVNLTSRLSASRWQTLLDGEEHVRDVTEPPSDAPGEFRTVRITLDPGVTYRLQLTKVGVGTRVTEEPPEYLTREGGPVEPVTKGQSRDVTLEVRDAYNNPVSGVSVNASVDGDNTGSLAQEMVYTDGDGHATFTYETTGSTSADTHQINATTNATAALDARPFDGSLPKNVTVDVRVQGGGGGGGGGAGAYDISWTDPQDTDGNGGDALSDCSQSACTWDVGASDGDTLALESVIDPTYEGVDVDFAVSDSSVGTVSPGNGTTGSDGAATTTLTAQSDGTVDVLASTSEGSAVIEVTVENVEEASSSEQVGYVDGSGTARVGDESRVDFDVQNTGSESATITGIRVESTGSNHVTIAEYNGGSGAGQHEVYIAASTPGRLEVNSYSIGTTTSLTASATLAPGEQAQVTMLNFRNNGGNTVSAADDELTVTLFFQDGSSTTFSFVPPGY
ncbi:Ig-like domain (group 1) [Halomicrobium zhouii]|uniref:Ig-like domain (Group 1) n=1 Tax=Halomicrobium zhouii TaxID=767519 RepID=A0A1I6KN18_9EURY|nr:Ig-like domain-containing protein [Halomicrobium zhouii]SFR92652.1 Ig-like domain (group 1) [Halomicrobium zhouii]